MPEFPTASDIAEIDRRGIARSEIDRQLAALRDPPAPIELAHPCRVGRGIEVLARGDWSGLEREWETAARGGRLLKFVPASGAATRMFSFLQSFLETGEGRDSPLTARFLANRERLPLPADPAALGELAARPKGLLPFHAYGSERRSALAEHLFESTTYLAPRGGTQRLHFTVSPEHLAQFEAAAKEHRATLAREDWDIQVDFSVQDASTDTLAATLEGQPARRPNGRLLFRPAGHGALIENLERTDGDLVFIKNIDNIARRERHDVNGHWKRRLAGHLIGIQQSVWEVLDELEGHGDAADASERGRELAGRFGWSDEETGGTSAAGADTRRRELVGLLDRPLRVCGVVQNLGEPGGGPFSVGGADGWPRLQIVEAAQIDTGNPSQETIRKMATHFNPVDLVCALRDRRNRPYDLGKFIDPATSMVSVKQDGDRQIRVLERPGLWNGAMAGWNTVFVEVPQQTFTPVKTVLDLLRPEHQP